MDFFCADGDLAGDLAVDRDLLGVLGEEDLAGVLGFLEEEAPCPLGEEEEEDLLRLFGVGAMERKLLRDDPLFP